MNESSPQRGFVQRALAYHLSIGIGGNELLVRLRRVRCFVIVLWVVVLVVFIHLEIGLLPPLGP